MKKFVLLILFVLFPAICYAQPSIVFDVENRDLGALPDTDLIEYTFEFTNAGDQELVVDKLITS